MMMKQFKKRLTLARLSLAIVTLSGAALAHSGFGDGFGHEGAGCDREGSEGQGYHHEGYSHHRGDNGHHAGSQEKYMQRRISRMQRELDLNEDQVSRLTALFEQQQQTRMHQEMPPQRHPMMSLNPGASDYDRQVQEAITERQALMAEHMQAKAELHKKLYQILTPEQQEKMQQWRSHHQE